MPVASSRCITTLPLTWHKYNHAPCAAGPAARLSRPFRVEIDLRGRLLVVDDARERGSLRLVDANLIPPEVSYAVPASLREG